MKCSVVEYKDFFTNHTKLDNDVAVWIRSILFCNMTDLLTCKSLEDQSSLINGVQYRRCGKSVKPMVVSATVYKRLAQ